MTLIGFGTAELVAACVLRSRTELAVTLVVFGSGLTVLGASLPDVEEADITPKGLKFKKRVREGTSSLAAGDSTPELATSASEHEDQAEIARFAVAVDAMTELLHPDDGPLASATLHLYLYDEDADRLLALGVEGPAGEEGWAIGQGATGAAYELEQYVVATGSAVSDSTYGLTEEQQLQAKDLVAVAALPVRNLAGDVIAVLTASSEDPDNQIATEEGFYAQLAAAQKVARVLIDLLSWFDDA